MIVETTTFRLKVGAEESAFLRADAEAQTRHYYAQNGIVRRTTARSASGGWLVLTFWDSLADAEAAGACVGIDEFVDAATVAVSRFETLD